MIKQTYNQQVIKFMMRQDYWRAVRYRGHWYFRTFEDAVIYHTYDDWRNS